MTEIRKEQSRRVVCVLFAKHVAIPPSLTIDCYLFGFRLHGVLVLADSLTWPEFVRFAPGKRVFYRSATGF